MSPHQVSGRNGMTMPKKDDERKAFVIGYIVQAYDTQLTELSADPKELSRFLYDQSALASIRAIAWLGEQDDKTGETSACAVLMMEEAEETYDHLVWWTEGAPEHRFRVYLIREGENYSFALFPDLDVTKEKFHERFPEIKAEDINHMTVAMTPLTFQGPGGPHVAVVEAYNLEAVHVYMADVKLAASVQQLLAGKGPEALMFDDIFMDVGIIPVGHEEGIIEGLRSSLLRRIAQKEEKGE